VAANAAGGRSLTAFARPPRYFAPMRQFLPAAYFHIAPISYIAPIADRLSRQCAFAYAPKP
jgi:hypothetical protein